ncbi:MAG: ribonuclease HII [Bacteroidales bacterium]|jgi:ribonuclease HII|nr:ribonuclease HII [Bacteroidales bacterium]MCI1732875.1 ribonuclease HII [Bacteroidales bacterium]
MANLKPFFNAGVIEAGCDEAGRGCLAGPVYAAAVILPKDFYHPLLNDSKQLTKKQRDELRPIIMKEAVAYGIASVSPKEIDKINILNASIKAMHKALQKLKPQPVSIIVDGNKFKPYKKIQHKCIVKGDATYASIAAASILAKTSRDAYMLKIAKEFPQYGWDKNMAYPTKEHRAAIEKYGVTKYHRMTYQLLPELKLF